MRPRPVLKGTGSNCTSVHYHRVIHRAVRLRIQVAACLTQLTFVVSSQALSASATLPSLTFSFSSEPESSLSCDASRLDCSVPHCPGTDRESQVAISRTPGEMSSYVSNATDRTSDTTASWAEAGRGGNDNDKRGALTLDVQTPTPSHHRNENVGPEETAPDAGTSPRPDRLHYASSSGSNRSRYSPPRSGDGGGHSPRDQNGPVMVVSPGENDRRRKAKSERSKVSPLSKRLGEEPPFMLPHPSKSDTSSQLYPGLVIGSFAGGGNGTGLGFDANDMHLDGSMDGVVDRTAASQPDGRQHGGSGQAGANIAPWLMDDGPKSPGLRSPTPAGPSDPQATTMREPASRKGSTMQVLNHFASVPALPKIRRQGNAGSQPDDQSGPSSRSGSDPSILPRPGIASRTSFAGGSKDGNSPLAGSGESLQTLTTAQQERTGSALSAEPGSQTSQPGKQSNAGTGNRTSRFGSNASNGSRNGSGGSEKKKGFLGGLLKRKTGASMSMRESSF